MKSFKVWSLKLTLLFAAICATYSRPAFAQTVPTTVILVHGAFADGSSWNRVIPLLQAQGLKVVAVQLPLSSLAADVAATKRAITAQTGPIILVGHSWAGVVITEAGVDDRVKALVYVSAFAPSEGQSAGEMGKPYPTPPGLLHPIADSSGYLTLSPGDIAKHFAPDVPAAESNLLAVTQGPIRAANFDEPVSAAAWKTKPSWLIAGEQDQMIDPALYKAEAEKIHAKATWLASGHVPMLSHPDAVTAVIVEAAHSIARSSR
ncbi:alpha/beta fold hydrolase [Granulicella mallensis]|uniref:Putative hydrolase or acyltransferase (Alpha/beta hydrolase superfamily) n=1 Tax=Granulicella mallensis (strain ATCC BAA-1857 / DSM 23137 / MP5ACTX8) TaxID=682795 RepID=G8P0G1_GRAMM|nr:alpha/beta hydrolase [Granulicella mallensis]AEU38049.1 putative hydrolase or acyltransferase (alpha/beta hydrolase superfamily) [Granulicella mallensis MP5ACTX8]